MIVLLRRFDTLVEIVGLRIYCTYFISVRSSPAHPEQHESKDQKFAKSRIFQYYVDTIVTYFIIDFTVMFF